MFQHHGDAGWLFVGRRVQPDRDAEECRDRNVERDAHALHGAAQDHPFAVKFDVSHPSVRHGVARREAKGQSERVEPRDAARPGGVPAELGLTPQNTLPVGLFVLCPTLT